MIAIISTLPLGADAVFDETYDRLGKFYGKQPGSGNSYINGRIGDYNTLLSYMPGTGKGGAASVAPSLRVSYPGIQLALVVGICGALYIPLGINKIFLGEVIISNAMIEYDFGRQYLSGFQRKTDVDDTLGRPDRISHPFFGYEVSRRLVGELFLARWAFCIAGLILVGWYQYHRFSG